MTKNAKTIQRHYRENVLFKMQQKRDGCETKKIHKEKK